jgi:hypothetical protein
MGISAEHFPATTRPWKQTYQLELFHESTTITPTFCSSVFHDLSEAGVGCAADVSLSLKNKRGKVNLQ